MQITSEVEVVTPVRAAELLGSNNCNRPLMRGWTFELAKAITRGEWELNGESIKIGSNGELLDGQHRLAALIKADKPVPLLVTRGIDPRTFHTIDSGKRRSISDVLAMRGVKNAVTVGSMARCLLTMEDRVLTGFYTTPQLEDAIDRYPRAPEWAARFNALKYARRIAGSYFPAVLTKAETTNDADECMEFLERFDDGARLSAKSPILLLRDRLSSAKLNVGITRLQAGVAMCLTIKAWNAYSLGKEVGTLRYRPADDEFPTVR